MINLMQLLVVEYARRVGASDEKERHFLIPDDPLENAFEILRRILFEGPCSGSRLVVSRYFIQNRMSPRCLGVNNEYCGLAVKKKVHLPALSPSTIAL